MMAIATFLGGSLLGFSFALAGLLSGHLTVLSAFGLYLASSLTLSLFTVAVLAYGAEGSEIGRNGL